METVVVPTFGGGINVAQNPCYIDPSEWLWSNGFWPNRGTAEIMRGYTTLVASGWQPSSHRALGVVPELFRATGIGYVLAITRHDSTSTDTGVVLVDKDGTATALSSTGTEPDASSLTSGASGMAVVNGLGYVALGTAASSALLQYTPATIATNGTFTRVNPSGGLSALYCASSGSRVFLAAAATTSAGSFVRSRQVKYSDVLDGTTWVAAISNSADSVSLDSRTPITGLAAITGGMIVTSMDATYIFRATGSIPAYTVETIVGEGSLISPVSTPVGVVASAPDGLYVVGGGRLSDRLGRLPRAAYELYWHPEYRAVLMPHLSGGTEDDTLFVDPTSGIAWRAALPANVSYRGLGSGNTCVTSFDAGPDRKWIQVFLGGAAGSETIYAESRTMTDAYSGAYVRSKLFTFGAPPMYGRMHRIKVDVEPLSNATTDSIKVSAVQLDHLSQSVLGSLQMDMDGFTYTDIPGGTLTGGTSELPCDLYGKYIGLQFTQVSGKSRIRGFSFEWSPAGDRIP